MGLYDVRDSIVTLKRDFARVLCEDIYAWWFDQHAEADGISMRRFISCSEDRRKSRSLHTASTGIKKMKSL